MSKRTVLLPLGVILAVVGGFFLYMGLQHRGAEDWTVSQLKAQGDEVEEVEVKGTVKPGTVRWDSQGQVLRFALTDGEETLEVSYQGKVPEDFKPGVEMEVEGKYNGGVLEAQTLGRKSSPLCQICH